MATKSTRTQAQEAAIDEARARKATIPETPFIETVSPESATVELPKFDWAYLIKGEASWKRWAMAAIASLSTTAAVGYIGAYFMSYLTVAAILVSSSTFIAMIVYVLSLLLVIYAAYRASTFTYLKVIDKTVDRNCSAAWNWVSSKFSSPEKVAA